MAPIYALLPVHFLATVVAIAAQKTWPYGSTTIQQKETEVVKQLACTPVYRTDAEHLHTTHAHNKSTVVHIPCV